MPSGKTHDLITLLLAIPTFIATLLFTKSYQLACVVTAAMIFGGMMFGPDLDINSRQYQRWGPLRIIWWPYKVLFKHRSRFTHGILLGTVVRIIYFLLAVGLILAAVIYLREVFQGGQPQGDAILFTAGERVIILIKKFDRQILIGILIGLWWGAASHTISDLVVTSVKQLFKSL